MTCLYLHSVIISLTSINIAWLLSLLKNSFYNSLSRLWCKYLSERNGDNCRRSVGAQYGQHSPRWLCKSIAMINPLGLRRTWNMYLERGGRINPSSNRQKILKLATHFPANITAPGISSLLSLTNYLLFANLSRFSVDVLAFDISNKINWIWWWSLD